MDALQHLMSGLASATTPTYLLFAFAGCMLGTLIGLLPGVATMSFFVDRAVAAIRHPGIVTFVLLAAAVALIVGLAFTLRRRLRNRAPSAPAPSHGS